jgi:hypothetical protein
VVLHIIMGDEEVRAVLGEHMSRALGEGWQAACVSVRRKAGNLVEADMDVISPDETPIHPDPPAPTGGNKR